MVFVSFFRSQPASNSVSISNTAIAPLLRFHVREVNTTVGNLNAEGTNNANKCHANAAAKNTTMWQRETTGLHVWPSSLLLGAHMVQIGAQGGLHGLCVLELGSGTGIAGLCAALCPTCKRVILTDGDPRAVQNLRRTVQDLASEFDLSKACDAAARRW